MWFLCRCWEVRAATHLVRRGDLKLLWQRSPCLLVVSFQAQQGEQSKRQEAEQSQLALPLPRCQMLHAPPHLCHPSPDPLQDVRACLVLGSPELDAALQVHLTRAEQRRRTTSPVCWQCLP